MMAEASDDRAFGMFSPGLQRRITETRKELAEMTKELGKQKIINKQRADEANKIYAEEQRQNRNRLVVVGMVTGAYLKMSRAIEGLRQAGMENTVEANRQQIAYTFLGREIAGIFLPATNAATNATMASARALSGLSEGGQNVAMVLGSATAGLVAFSVAGIAATAMGLKFTGVLAGIMKWLPLIGLGGGLLVGLGALFLQTKDGADLMNKALEKGVDLLNEMAKGVETLKGKWGNGGWLDRETTNLAIGLSVIGEKLGLLEAGTAKAVFNADAAARRDYKPEPGKKPTPGNYRFEGVSDAFERVQLAAAKQAGLDVPQKQLKVQEEQLEELRRMNAGNVMRPLPWWHAMLIPGLAAASR